MKVEFVLEFPHDYEVEEGGDLPSGGTTPVKYLPSETALGRDGVFLRFTLPGRPSWLGQFAFGRMGHLNAVYSCPNPEVACVLTEGRAYLVDVHSASFLAEVRCAPVKQVVPLVASNLILFVDDIGITAIGRDGEAWRSARVAWDEAVITGHDQTYVWGTGFDPTNNKSPRSSFKVELSSGAVVEKTTWTPD